MGLEGEHFADHEVHDDAQGPHVDLFVIGLLEQNFRCHVGWGATAVENLVAAWDNFWKSEVRDLHSFDLGMLARVVLSLMTVLLIPIKLNKNVFWFDITMQNATAMQVLNAFE